MKISISVQNVGLFNIKVGIDVYLWKKILESKILQLMQGFNGCVLSIKMKMFSNVYMAICKLMLGVFLL